MGFFDRFSSKKPAPTPAATPAAPAVSAVPGPTIDATPRVEASAPVQVSAVGVKPRLAAARESLQLKDLAGAMAVYEELLASAGDRADVLVTVSGDLGSHGHVAEIIELIAPRYDADRHGPATGLNLLQAYLAVRNADAAQHVLDILFALNRPELEDRLHGFSNAIAEVIASPFSAEVAMGRGADATKVGLISISKPIWFYGFEALGSRILPPKEGELRRIAFAQFALPGHGERQAVAADPGGEDELGRLSRGIPMWLAETFYFSPLYRPIAAIGLVKPPDAEGRFVTFDSAWSIENLRQLVDSTEGGLDYIVTGNIHIKASDYEVTVRIWEVKTFRERRVYTVRWTPGNADTTLAHLQAQVRGYMEWSPTSAALAYAIPVRPRTWVDTLSASLTLFLAEKALLAKPSAALVDEDVKNAARQAPTGEAESLAYLALKARAQRLGFDAKADGTLARSPVVMEAQTITALG